MVLGKTGSLAKSHPVFRATKGGETQSLLFFFRHWWHLLLFSPISDTFIKRQTVVSSVAPLLSFGLVAFALVPSCKSR